MVGISDSLQQGIGNEKISQLLRQSLKTRNAQKGAGNTEEMGEFKDDFKDTGRMAMALTNIYNAGVAFWGLGEEHKNMMNTASVDFKVLM